MSAFLIDRINKFWVEGFADGLVSLSLHWGSCLAKGGDLFRFRIPSAVSHSYSHPQNPFKIALFYNLSEEIIKDTGKSKNFSVYNITAEESQQGINYI